MKVKFIGDEDSVFCYGERGQKSKDRPSILFIHGYTGSKDQWLTGFKVQRSLCVAHNFPPKPEHTLSLRIKKSCIKSLQDLTFNNICLWHMTFIPNLKAPYPKI